MVFEMLSVTSKVLKTGDWPKTISTNTTAHATLAHIKQQAKTQYAPTPYLRQLLLAFLCKAKTCK